MHKILIATNNKGKLKEITEFFKTIKNIEFVSLNDFSEAKKLKDIDENGKTFEENALIKAQYFANHLKIITIGEDSGLILKAFPDKFGLKTKRELTAKDDMDWLTQFLDLLESTNEKEATFYSAMAIVIPKSIKNKLTNINNFTCLGSTTGTIEEFPQTPLEPGIPVSAVFTPENCNQVFSAMSKQQKNKISHRGKSAKKMLDFIIQNFN